MASSPDAADLPPALKSLWRSVKLGYQAEPLLLVVSAGLALGAAVPDALFALWLKLLADGVPTAQGYSSLPSQRMI